LEKFGWPRYYAGGVRRAKAEALGLSLDEYNKLGESDPTTDSEVDEYLKTLGETKDNFIAEGRTAWFFIPQSIKIYLTINENKAAYLIFRDLQRGVKRNESNNINSEADMLASIRDRMLSDKLRYQKYYGFDVFDPAHYNFTLDTTNLTTTEAGERVYEFIKNKLSAS
jgi:cytidylate kinase